MNKESRKSFDYSSLPFYLKISNWLSWFAVVRHLKKGSWLDIMCGYQAMLQVSQLKNPKFTKFYALDQSLNSNLENKNFSLKKYSINNDLPFTSGQFDNITFINGLEHLKNPEVILNDTYRVLKNKGVFQLIVPTWFGKRILEFLAFKLKVQKQICEGMNDHKMYYDEKTIWPMLVAAGFEPKDIYIKRIKFYCSLYIRVSKNYK